MCSNYKCEWLINDQIPEELKPSLTDMVISNNGDELHVTVNGDKYKPEYLEFVKDYAIKTNQNLSWFVDNKLDRL